MRLSLMSLWERRPACGCDLCARDLHAPLGLLAGAARYRRIDRAYVDRFGGSRPSMASGPQRVVDEAAPKTGIAGSARGADSRRAQLTRINPKHSRRTRPNEYCGSCGVPREGTAFVGSELVFSH